MRVDTAMIPGEMVNLRAVERHDAPLIHRWLNDPLMMRGWGWSAPARSLQDVAQQVEGWLLEEPILGRPAALIVETMDGEAVGLAILRGERPEARAVELSLLIAADRWGQGLGADALHTLLDAGFDAWGVHRVGVRVEAGNARALALYRRCGFQEEGTLRQAAFIDGAHADIRLFSLLAPEWATRASPPPPQES